MKVTTTSKGYTQEINILSHLNRISLTGSFKSRRGNVATGHRLSSVLMYDEFIEVAYEAYFLVIAIKNTNKVFANQRRTAVDLKPKETLSSQT